MTIAIDVQPELGIYKVLRHLKYKPWFAIAEFVDNSLQSFITKNGKHGHREQCVVHIEYSPNTDYLEIRDNSYGISEIDFTRAFKAGLPPSDSSGLSEFGIGMKSAGMWFSPRWEVETSPIESASKYRIIFDVEDILASRGLVNAVQLEPDSVKGYTILRLYNCHQRLVGRTLGKVKTHLASIYREFLRGGELVLIVNGESIEYHNPNVLLAPHVDHPHSDPILWKREISIDLAPGKHIHGFYALRAVGSRAEAGFALFRRKRLILGSFDDTYRPHEIFGDSGSFVYQRLFGELYLEGFDVSHTKDDFIWGDDEIGLIDALLSDLRESQYLKQATSSYRRLADDTQYSVELAKGIAAVASAFDDTTQKRVSELLAHYTTSSQEAFSSQDTLLSIGDLAVKGDNSPAPEMPLELGKTISSHCFTIGFKKAGELWNIHIRLDDTPSKILYTLTADDPESLRNIAPIRNITGKIYANHDLIRIMCGNSSEAQRVVITVVASLICTEVQIRMQYPFSSALRHIFNELLQVVVTEAGKT